MIPVRNDAADASVDLSVAIGRLRLKNPVVAASGTFGTGLELARYVNPGELGAVTVKSLSIEAWEGNPPPRLTTAPAGMLNSVGLQNPGIDAWINESLPGLRACGATIIVSVWGRSVDEFGEAIQRLACEKGIGAIELNLSCPNLESASEMFSHSIEATAEVTRAAAMAISGSDIVLLAKLSPNTLELVEIARAAVQSGAEGLTLVNSVLGMRIDPITGEPALSHSPCGLSGPAIRPIAIRCVYEVSKAMPEVSIIGTGGVTDGQSAIEMMRAGATAIGVGTASFYDPRATKKVLRQVQQFCKKRRIASVEDLIGPGVI